MEIVSSSVDRMLIDFNDRCYRFEDSHQNLRKLNSIRLEKNRNELNDFDGSRDPRKG
jgi:hypothetical protein